jgi:OOP family OmpA-OmpF porin
MRWLAVLLLACAPGLARAADAPPPDPVDGIVYFGSASASLTADAYDLLRQVAAALRANPRLRVEVEGHSDASASAATNEPLAQQRAEAVREFLVSAGIAPERLVAKGYGAWRPVNDNSTLELRAWNRRVLFRRLEGAR